ncbi:MAG: DUF4296 domain-containing protein [Agriterribacter sp.]
MNRSIYAVLIALLFLCACGESNKVPDNVIPTDEMCTILFEINMAEEFVSAYVSRDSTKNKDVEINKEYQKIFLMHGITENDFRQSYDFYKGHPDIYKTLMDTLNARAQRKRTQLYQVHGS